MTTTTNAREQELAAETIEAAPDSQEFESYYDRDSGAWSLRRVPSAPPVALADDS
ncbi:MAG: hypothetical protein JST00_09545 [Deltaproteobacteria bacterium]|nr:hypothetical protein [Deltaproteobacteria bacterium]